jgi:hypothetical protein
MKLYCSNCGVNLKLIRKALPKYGTVIDLVEPHKCLDSPVDPHTAIINAPVFEGESDKFVKSLNELKPSDVHPMGVSFEKRPRVSSMTGTDDLRDRRFDQESKIASTAPSSVLDQIKQMGNSIPSHDLKDDTSDSEMGG